MVNFIRDKNRRGPRFQVYEHQIIVFLIFTLLLVSCKTENIPQIPTKTIIPSHQQTATANWFPPTITPSPLPTKSPSEIVNDQPRFGIIITEENFDVPDRWITGRMDAGTIAITNNEISLAVIEPGGYLFSIRNSPIYDNFYAEMIATTSICQGPDEFGLLLRYNSPVDFYRFSLSCDGKTRLDKLHSGIASSPQPWLTSTSIPFGSPSTIKLAAWVSGNEMRFYINDEFQFSINDQTIQNGLIGVFTRSGGDNAVTVGFSNLSIYQINDE